MNSTFLFFSHLLFICNIAFSFQISRLQHQQQATIRLFASSPLEDTESRQRRSIKLPRSGKTATLISRKVPIISNISITIWEWENPAQVVESYWEAAQHQSDNAFIETQSRVLDPFGIVAWPGSVVAAQELYKYRDIAVENQSILILGAGVGLEAQASARLGARQVLATDIHPTTLRQLNFGVEKEDAIIDKAIVQTQILDLFAHEEQPLPTCDTLIVADVLYNEQLASQVTRRIVEAWTRNPKVRVLVTDSQGFVPDFAPDLSRLMKDAGGPLAEFKEQNLKAFTGSGVCIDEDQTYSVIVRKMWIGLQLD